MILVTQSCAGDSNSKPRASGDDPVDKNFNYLRVR